MTSTTSSSNKNFAKLFKWAFARNKSIIIVYSILMVIGIIIDLYITSVVTRDSSNYNPIDMEIRANGTLGNVSIMIAQLGAVLLSIISAVHTFSFLHNKRSTDMFGSIPATRTTLYFSHLLAGIVSVSIPFTAGSLAVTGFTCRSLTFLGYDLMIILFGLLGIIAVYSFTTLIAYACGTASDTNIITLGSNAIYIGVVAVFWSIACLMIPGTSFPHVFNTPVMTLLAPMGFCYYLDSYLFSNQMTALAATLVWIILFIAVVILLGIFAAKRRKAETAQNEFNIKWLPIVIKSGISVLGGGFAGLCAATGLNSGFSNMYAFAFWYIVIGFASFFILHLIFSRGLKGKLLPSLFAYLGTTVAALAIIFAMTTGLGIDTFVPASSNVSYVSMGYDGIQYTDPENVETVTEIHKTIVEGLQKQISRPYYIGCTNDYNLDYYNDKQLDFNRKHPLTSHASFKFTYYQKLGFTINREYYLNGTNIFNYDCDKIEKLLQKLYNSKEYKKISNNLLWECDGAKKNGKLPSTLDLNVYRLENDNPSEDDASLSVVSDGSILLSNDEKFVEGLYKVLREDILADNEYYRTILAYQNMSTEYTLESYLDQNMSTEYTLESYLELYVQYNDREAYDNPLQMEDYFSYLHVNIPTTYTNTLNYLSTDPSAREIIDNIK